MIDASSKISAEIYFIAVGLLEIEFMLEQV